MPIKIICPNPRRWYFCLFVCVFTYLFTFKFIVVILVNRIINWTSKLFYSITFLNLFISYPFIILASAFFCFLHRMKATHVHPILLESKHGTQQMLNKLGKISISSLRQYLIEEWRENSFVWSEGLVSSLKDDPSDIHLLVFVFPVLPFP